MRGGQNVFLRLSLTASPGSCGSSTTPLLWAARGAPAARAHHSPPRHARFILRTPRRSPRARCPASPSRARRSRTFRRAAARARVVTRAPSPRVLFSCRSRRAALLRVSAGSRRAETGGSAGDARRAARARAAALKRAARAAAVLDDADAPRAAAHALCSRAQCTSIALVVLRQRFAVCLPPRPPRPAPHSELILGAAAYGKPLQRHRLDARGASSR